MSTRSPSRTTPRLAWILTVATITLWPVYPARAQITWVANANPTGLPDLSQLGLGYCAAASMANLLWEWSEHAPYNGAPRLVPHPNAFGQIWPGTWGNWSADGDALVLRLGQLIYNEQNALFDNGYGVAGGTTKYLQERGHLYSSGFFGGGNPNGLSVHTYSKDNATYAKIIDLVLGVGGYQATQTHWFWHLPNGNAVENNGEKSRHALGIAGLAATEIYLTNGWGNHSPNANPVATAYYDHYTNITIAPRLRIPSNVNNNALLVHRIANSAASDYVELYEIVAVKRGGSPEVGLQVTPYGPYGRMNTYTYQVYNPDPYPQYHFYVELLGGVASAVTSVQSPSGWAYEVWNPAGPIANPFGGPDDGTDLFGAPVNEMDSDFNLAWQPNWSGLHWYTSTAPIYQAQISTFTLQLSAFIPYTLDKVALTVVGEENNAKHSYNMVGGPNVGGVPDEYLCYEDKPSKFPAQSKFGGAEITTEDQFSQMQRAPANPYRNYLATKYLQLCVPQLPEPPGGDDSVHLNEYSIKDSKVNANPAKFIASSKLVPPMLYNLADRFGMYSLIEVKKPISVRMPAGKTDYGPIIKCDSNADCTTPLSTTCTTGGICLPAEPPLASPGEPTITGNYPTHEVCYAVKAPKIDPAPTATLVDQFGYSERYELKKITKVCAPADKNYPAAPIGDPISAGKQIHHICYAVKSLKTEPVKFLAREVQIQDQIQPQFLDIKKQKELCVPSVKLP